MEKNFLILVEGRKDPNTIANIFNEIFEDLLKWKYSKVLGIEKYKKYLELLEIKLIKNSNNDRELDSNNPQNIVNVELGKEELEESVEISFETVNKDAEKHRINIYIKKAISQNIRDFIDNTFDRSFDRTFNNSSLKKTYSLDRELTYSYSIFDYDPGNLDQQRTQITEYFTLKDDVDNFYPVLTYPGIEAQDFHYFSNEIINNYESILFNISNDGQLQSLHKDLTVEKIFKVEDRVFTLKDITRISTFIKSFRRQVFRNISTDETNKINNYTDYLKSSIEITDNIDILENQNSLYNKKIKKSDDEFLLISFIFSVFENICEWIIEEDDE